MNNTIQWLGKLLLSFTLFVLANSSYAATQLGYVSADIGCEVEISQTPGGPLYYSPPATNSTTGTSCASSSAAFSSPGITRVAADMMDILNYQDPASSLGACSFNGETYDCNIGTAASPVLLECYGTGSMSCIDQNEAISMSCDMYSEGNAQCSISINNIETYCADNAKECATLLSNTEQCEQGLASCNPNYRPMIEVFSSSMNNLCEYSGGEETPTDFDDLCDEMDGMSEMEKSAAIEALMPENMDIASDSSFLTQTEVMNYISNHLYKVKHGLTNTPTNKKQQYFYANQWLEDYALLASNDISASDATPNTGSTETTINISKDGRFSLFVNASYLTAKQGVSELEGKSKSDSITLTFGGDYRLDNNTVVGSALSYSDGSTKYGRQNKNALDTKQYNLTVYGSHYINNWWIDGSLLYGLSNFDQERDISCSLGSCSSITNTYTADYDGQTTAISFGAGYDFNMNALSISPFAQLNVGTIKVDSYQENAEIHGGPAARLDIDEQKRDFSSASFGSYCRYVINTDKAVLVPTLRIALNHDFEDDTQSISGRIIGANDSDFIADANPTDTNYITIGAGLNFQLANGNSGFIDIETIEAYDNLDQYRFTAGWRWEL